MLGALSKVTEELPNTMKFAFEVNNDPIAFHFKYGLVFVRFVSKIIQFVYSLLLVVEVCFPPSLNSLNFSYWCCICNLFKMLSLEINWILNIVGKEGHRSSRYLQFGIFFNCPVAISHK